MSLAHQDLAWSDMFQTDVGSELHLFGLRTQKDKADRRPIQSSVRAMHARVGEFSPMGMSLAHAFSVTQHNAARKFENTSAADLLMPLWVTICAHIIEV
mmetsp:Transcript_28898/g.46381  ORF Transcript_28898/g.46381 Transcript_28898/m.46381 type:complete len:99 (+) Transcript_28898:48-344(+)|eukprot:CAMPEP_0115047580 /NCGR_PEP_ID=MMETSP0227-20121206/28_1 /TAXON_ID=89957 /ORGANISM="Polarella glacialis, Strain CCMP 1383" /LENGTH=98 /DNA_ID=CAMNT_0002430781 /DNA_START=1593 /DNA_END=1889 /DNA_ORIENTATION=-